MSQPDPSPVPAVIPAESPLPAGGHTAARRARLEREAAALRENLRRRKGQTRARADDTPIPPDMTRAD